MSTEQNKKQEKPVPPISEYILNKRELVAAMMLQSLLSNPANNETSNADLVNEAIDLTNLLLSSKP